MNEAEISKLRITVENDAGEATAKLLSLAAAMRAIRDVSKNSKFTGISNLASAIKELMASIAGISNADITRLERMSNAIKNMAGVKFSRSFFNAMKGAAGEARDMSMVLYNNSTGSKRGYAWNSNGRGRGDASFGGYIGDANFGGGGGGGGGDVPPIDFGSLFGDEKKDNGNYGRNAVIFRKIFRTVDTAKKKMGEFVSSIKRIALYRIIRRGLMLIANAFKEGYQNAVEWSRINNTQLYESFKHLQASSLAMKNALGAALGELLITFEPLLSGLALKIANVANEFANMFAYMAGRKEYQRAITDTNKLAAAQEKLNRTLLGFDEINKLNGTHDVSDYFETVNIDEQNAERMEKALKGIGTALTAIAAALAVGKLLDIIAQIRTVNALLTTTKALTTAINSSVIFAGGAGGLTGGAGGLAGGTVAAGGATVMSVLGSAAFIIPTAAIIAACVIAFDYTKKHYKEITDLALKNVWTHETSTSVEGKPLDPVRYNEFRNKVVAAGLPDPGVGTSTLFAWRQIALEELDKNTRAAFAPNNPLLDGTPTANYYAQKYGNQYGYGVDIPGDANLVIRIEDAIGNPTAEETVNLMDFLNGRAGQVVVGSPKLTR